MTLLASSTLLPLILCLPAQDDPKPRPDTSTIRVHLAAEASVPGHEILVGDLARVDADDEDLAERIAQLSLGTAPIGTWARWVHAADVRRALLGLGIPPTRLRLTGMHRVQVTAARERVAREEVVQAAENVLRAMLRDEGETDATWDLTTVPGPTFVPRGRKGREIIAKLTTNRLAASAASFRVDVVVDGQVATSVSLGFRIRRYREALVTLAPVRKGERVDIAAIASRRVEMTGQLVEPLTHRGEITGFVASRALRAGTILSEADLMKPALILKGNTVRIVAAFGRVKVTAKGIAQRDGARGDTIPVLVGTKKAPIFGVVDAVGMVIVGDGAQTADRNGRRR